MATRVRQLAAAVKEALACAAGAGRPGRRAFLAAAWLGAVSVFRAVAGLAPRRALGAQLPAKAGTDRVPRSGTLQAPALAGQGFRVSVKSLVVEGGSTPGETVTLKMRVDTAGGGTASVPWVLYRGNAVVSSGIRPNVAAGTSFEVSAAWQAVAGTQSFHGAVDPQNTLREAAQELRDNVTQTVTRTFTDWPKWIGAAKTAIQLDGKQWLAKLQFAGIVINGPIAAGGRLEPTTDLKTPLAARLRAAGAPGDVAQGFAEAVADAFSAWAASVRVPALPWYPAFAAWPSAWANPMPNLPTPVIALLQDVSPLQPPALSAAIKRRVGDAAAVPGGGQAIDDFCQWLSVPFNVWLAACQVMGVMGKGPVPSFAPPYNPVGPVVMGDNVPTPGHLRTSSPEWR